MGRHHQKKGACCGYVDDGACEDFDHHLFVFLYGFVQVGLVPPALTFTLDADTGLLSVGPPALLETLTGLTPTVEGNPFFLFANLLAPNDIYNKTWYLAATPTLANPFYQFRAVSITNMRAGDAIMITQGPTPSIFNVLTYACSTSVITGTTSVISGFTLAKPRHAVCRLGPDCGTNGSQPKVGFKPVKLRHNRRHKHRRHRSDSSSCSS